MTRNRQTDDSTTRWNKKCFLACDRSSSGSSECPKEDHLQRKNIWFWILISLCRRLKGWERTWKRRFHQIVSCIFLWLISVAAYLWYLLFSGLVDTELGTSLQLGNTVPHHLQPSSGVCAGSGFLYPCLFFSISLCFFSYNCKISYLMMKTTLLLFLKRYVCTYPCVHITSHVN